MTRKRARKLIMSLRSFERNDANKMLRDADDSNEMFWLMRGGSNARLAHTDSVERAKRAQHIYDCCVELFKARLKASCEESARKRAELGPDSIINSTTNFLKDPVI